MNDFERLLFLEEEETKKREEIVDDLVKSGLLIEYLHKVVLLVAEDKGFYIDDELVIDIAISSLERIVKDIK